MKFVRTFYYTLFVVCIQVQRFCHSQYYPPYDGYHDQSDSPPIGEENSEDFNRRDLEPPLRQHQHHLHSYQEARSIPDPPYKANLNYHSGRHYVNDEFVNPPKSSDYFRGDLENEEMETPFGHIKSSSDSFRVPSSHLNLNADSGPSTHRVVVLVIYRPEPCAAAEAVNPENNRSDQRRFKGDGKCYTILSKRNNPCGPLMKFYPNPDDEIYGECDCANDNGIVSRPLAYWKPHDRCYLLYHRGPCRQGEWLVLDDYGFPKCSHRHQECASDDYEAASRFTFLHEGRCYETGRHYSKFCTNSVARRHWKVYFPPGESQPKCMAAEPVPYESQSRRHESKFLHERYFLGSTTELRCKPGYKQMQNGECKRKVKFDRF